MIISNKEKTFQEVPASSDRARVLMVSPFLPSFPGAGGPARTYCLSRELSKWYQFGFVGSEAFASSPRAVEIARGLFSPFILSALTEPRPALPRGPIQRLIRILTSPPPQFLTLEPWRRALSVEFERLVAEWRPGLVEIQESVTIPWLGTKKLEVPLVITAHNLLHRLALRQAWLRGRWRDRLREMYWAWRLKRWELNSFRQASHIVVVSELEATALDRLLGGSVPISVVPNGVDVGYFSTEKRGDPKRLLFTGHMGYQPNQEAVYYFASEILPRVRRTVPGVTFSVVGMCGDEKLRKWADEFGFEAVGQVDDMRPYLESSGIVVVPLRSGAGTRLKILEALSMRRAVVSTSLGAEGLSCVSGDNLVLADSPVGFAGAILDLIRSDECREKLGAAGRLLVERSYDWSVISPKLEKVYQSLL